MRAYVGVGELCLCLFFSNTLHPIADDAPRKREKKTYLAELFKVKADLQLN